MSTFGLSVIVPVLNEASMLAKNIESFRLLNAHSELIFADGGSEDSSLKILRQNAFTVVSCDRGRATQMNCGAARSHGSSLLFLHADTVVPDSFPSLISAIIDADWGFFRLALSRRDWPFFIISSSINLRSKVFKIATGDQGIFVKRGLFDELGGFPNIALMEDIEVTRRLKKISPPKILPEAMVTSARRWEARGVSKTVLHMWFLQLAYKCGVPAKTIWQWYK